MNSEEREGIERIIDEHMMMADFVDPGEMGWTGEDYASGLLWYFSGLAHGILVVRRKLHPEQDPEVTPEEINEIMDLVEERIDEIERRLLTYTG